MVTKRHGGPRPNSGGKRPGAGRPDAGGRRTVTLSVSLPRDAYALIDTLQARLELPSSSAVVSRALVELARTVDAEREPEARDESAVVV